MSTLDPMKLTRQEVEVLRVFHFRQLQSVPCTVPLPEFMRGLGSLGGKMLDRGLLTTQPCRCGTPKLIPSDLGVKALERLRN